MTSTRRAQALKLLGARSMMRLKDFAAHRIGPETLARLVRDGTVVRSARGLYALRHESPDLVDHETLRRGDGGRWCVNL